MQDENQKSEPKPASSGSMKPPRPPRGTVVGADDGTDSGGGVKADYGCHEALWALSARYRESDIHGAYSTLVDQEKLLRDHIGFPGYKAQLAFTMALRSDILSHLGDAETASSIMAEASSIMAEAFSIRADARQGKFVFEVLLKAIRDLDEKRNVKWRQIDRAA